MINAQWWRQACPDNGCDRFFFKNDINNMHVRCVMADDRLLAKQK